MNKLAVQDNMERDIRLYLIAPTEVNNELAPAIQQTCAAGDVAALLFPTIPAGAIEIVATAQAAGVAVLSTKRDDADFVDGIHFDGGWLRLKAARGALPDSIIGFGGVASRHDGMQAGESGSDYVAIGRLLEIEDPLPDETRADLLDWWQTVMTVPVVIRSNSLKDAVEMARAGADFIALAPEIWTAKTASTDIAALQAALNVIGAETAEEAAV